MSSNDPVLAVTLQLVIINGSENMFVILDGDSCSNSFLYFFNQIVQMILTQLLKEVCVLRFHDLVFISVFNFSFSKGSGLVILSFPSFITQRWGKFWYYATHSTKFF